MRAPPWQTRSSPSALDFIRGPPDVLNQRSPKLYFFSPGCGSWEGGAPCCRSRSQSQCPIFHLDQVFADSDPFAVRSGFGIVVKGRAQFCHLDPDSRAFLFFRGKEKNKRHLANQGWDSTLVAKWGVCYWLGKAGEGRIDSLGFVFPT